jgi:MoaA/NifB/PqqE/SkfB family radical SAM enzyme
MNRPAFPLYASVNICTTCNLKCEYCYMRPHGKVLMSLEDFKLVVDQLAAGQIFYILLTGGEPFLHPRANDMIAYACERINEVSMVTNGTVISEEHFSFLKRSGFSNLRIQVSLDSIIEKENIRLRGTKPELILTNVERLSEIGINVSVGMVITRHNIDSIYDSIGYLRKHVHHFNLMVLQNTVWDNRLTARLGITDKQLDTLYEKIADLKSRNGLNVTLPKDLTGNEDCTACGAACAAGFTYLAIDPDLRVRPCDRVTNVFIGDLRQSSVEQIWGCPDLAKIHRNTIPICSEFK